MPPISFLPFLQTVPWGTRVLTSLILLASITQFFLASVVRQNSSVLPTYGHELPWLVLIPKTSWKFPWTLLTAGFVELNVFELLFSLITVPLACRYLERLWGIRELARFTCVVIVASNIIAFGFAWIPYIVLGSDAIM
jgi:membrane associated rhomboid family serine protease